MREVQYLYYREAGGREEFTSLVGGQARWVRASNYFPVRRSTARELEDYFAENPNYGAAFNMLDYGKSEPTIASYQQVRRLIQKAMVEAIEGEDMAQVLKGLQLAANKTIEQ